MSTFFWQSFGQIGGIDFLNLLRSPRFCRTTPLKHSVSAGCQYAIPGSGMKFRVGMGMGMGTAEDSGYGYTHFWVWPNTRVLGMGMVHKILGALKIARFSC